MPEPWSISVAIDWEPTVRYFEHRLTWLKDADAIHDGGSFRVTADLVGFRWGGGTNEVTLVSGGSRGLTASGDPSAVLALVEAGLTLCEPSRFRLGVASLQYVVPLTGEYDKLREAAGMNFLGELATQEHLTDFAILIDSNDADFARQMEFGIVSAKEIPPRLARSYGRMAGPNAVAPESYWARRKDLPPVALFIDVAWKDLRLKMRPGSEWLEPWWNQVREDAERAVGPIISRVS